MSYTEFHESALIHFGQPVIMSWLNHYGQPEESSLSTSTAKANAIYFAMLTLKSKAGNMSCKMETGNWQRATLLHEVIQCLYTHFNLMRKVGEFLEANEMTWSDGFTLQMKNRK